MITRGTAVTSSSNGAGTVVSSAITTTGPALLLAFSSCSDATQDITAISGGSLTWTVVDTRNQGTGSTDGVTSLWAAYATSALSSISFTLTYGTGSGFPQTAAVIPPYYGTKRTVATAISATAKAANASGTTASVVITTNNPNSLVVSTAAIPGTDVLTAGANQVITDTSSSAGNFAKVGDLMRKSATGSAGAVTMSFSFTTGALPWGMVAAELVAESPSFQRNNLRPAIFKPGLAR